MTGLVVVHRKWRKRRRGRGRSHLLTDGRGGIWTTAASGGHSNVANKQATRVICLGGQPKGRRWPTARRQLGAELGTSAACDNTIKALEGRECAHGASFVCDHYCETSGHHNGKVARQPPAKPPSPPPTGIPAQTAGSSSGCSSQERPEVGSNSITGLDHQQPLRSSNFCKLGGRHRDCIGKRMGCCESSGNSLQGLWCHAEGNIQVVVVIRWRRLLIQPSKFPELLNLFWRFSGWIVKKFVAISNWPTFERANQMELFLQLSPWVAHRGGRITLSNLSNFKGTGSTWELASGGGGGRIFVIEQHYCDRDKGNCIREAKIFANTDMRQQLSSMMIIGTAASKFKQFVVAGAATSCLSWLLEGPMESGITLTLTAPSSTHPQLGAVGHHGCQCSGPMHLFATSRLITRPDRPLDSPPQPPRAPEVPTLFSSTSSSLPLFSCLNLPCSSNGPRKLIEGFVDIIRVKRRNRMTGLLFCCSNRASRLERRHHLVLLTGKPMLSGGPNDGPVACATNFHLCPSEVARDPNDLAKQTRHRPGVSVFADDDDDDDEEEGELQSPQRRERKLWRLVGDSFSSLKLKLITPVCTIETAAAAAATGFELHPRLVSRTSLMPLPAHLHGTEFSQQQRRTAKLENDSMVGLITVVVNSTSLLFSSLHGQEPAMAEAARVVVLRKLDDNDGDDHHPSEHTMVTLSLDMAEPQVPFASAASVMLMLMFVQIISSHSLARSCPLIIHPPISPIVGTHKHTLISHYLNSVALIRQQRVHYTICHHSVGGSGSKWRREFAISTDPINQPDGMMRFQLEGDSLSCSRLHYYHCSFSFFFFFAGRPEPLTKWLTTSVDWNEFEEICHSLSVVFLLLQLGPGGGREEKLIDPKHWALRKRKLSRPSQQEPDGIRLLARGGGEGTRRISFALSSYTSKSNTCRRFVPLGWPTSADENSYVDGSGKLSQLVGHPSGCQGIARDTLLPLTSINDDNIGISAGDRSHLNNYSCRRVEKVKAGRQQEQQERLQLHGHGHQRQRRNRHGHAHGLLASEPCWSHASGRPDDDDDPNELTMEPNGRNSTLLAKLEGQADEEEAEEKVYDYICIDCDHDLAAYMDIFWASFGQVSALLLLLSLALLLLLQLVAQCRLVRNWRRHRSGFPEVAAAASKPQLATTISQQQEFEPQRGGGGGSSFGQFELAAVVKQRQPCNGSWLLMDQAGVLSKWRLIRPSSSSCKLADEAKEGTGALTAKDKAKNEELELKLANLCPAAGLSARGARDWFRCHPESRSFHSYGQEGAQLPQTLPSLNTATAAATTSNNNNNNTEHHHHLARYQCHYCTWLGSCHYYCFGCVCCCCCYYYYYYYHRCGPTGARLVGAVVRKLDNFRLELAPPLSGLHLGTELEWATPLPKTTRTLGWSSHCSKQAAKLITSRCCCCCDIAVARPEGPKTARRSTGAWAGACPAASIVRDEQDERAGGGGRDPIARPLRQGYPVALLALVSSPQIGLSSLPSQKRESISSKLLRSPPPPVLTCHRGAFKKCQRASMLTTLCAYALLLLAAHCLQHQQPSGRWFPVAVAAASATKVEHLNRAAAAAAAAATATQPTAGWPMAPSIIDAAGRHRMRPNGSWPSLHWGPIGMAADKVGAGQEATIWLRQQKQHWSSLMRPHENGAGLSLEAAKDRLLYSNNNTIMAGGSHLPSRHHHHHHDLLLGPGRHLDRARPPSSQLVPGPAGAELRMELNLEQPPAVGESAPDLLGPHDHGRIRRLKGLNNDDDNNDNSLGVSELKRNENNHISHSHWGPSQAPLQGEGKPSGIERRGRGGRRRRRSQLNGLRVEYSLSDSYDDDDEENDASENSGNDTNRNSFLVYGHNNIDGVELNPDRPLDRIEIDGWASKLIASNINDSDSLGVGAEIGGKPAQTWKHGGALEAFEAPPKLARLNRIRNCNCEKEEEKDIQGADKIKQSNSSTTGGPKSPSGTSGETRSLLREAKLFSPPSSSSSRSSSSFQASPISPPARGPSLAVGKQVGDEEKEDGSRLVAGRAGRGSGWSLGYQRRLQQQQQTLLRNNKIGKDEHRDRIERKLFRVETCNDAELDGDISFSYSLPTAASTPSADHQSAGETDKRIYEDGGQETSNAADGSTTMAGGSRLVQPPLLKLGSSGRISDNNNNNSEPMKSWELQQQHIEATSSTTATTTAAQSTSGRSKGIPEVGPGGHIFERVGMGRSRRGRSIIGPPDLHSDHGQSWQLPDSGAKAEASDDDDELKDGQKLEIERWPGRLARPVPRRIIGRRQAASGGEARVGQLAGRQNLVSANNWGQQRSQESRRGSRPSSSSYNLPGNGGHLMTAAAAAAAAQAAASSRLFDGSLDGNGGGPGGSQRLCPAACTCLWKNGKHFADCSNQLHPATGGQAKLRNQLPSGFDPLLQVLNYSANHLVELPASAFVNLNLNNLQRIYLSNCQLESIHPRAFNNLKLIVELDFSWNKLNYVPLPQMKQLTLMRRLTMRGNPLHRLNEATFSGGIGKQQATVGPTGRKSPSEDGGSGTQVGPVESPDSNGATEEAEDPVDSDTADRKWWRRQARRMYETYPELVHTLVQAKRQTQQEPGHDSNFIIRPTTNAAGATTNHYYYNDDDDQHRTSRIEQIVFEALDWWVQQDEQAMAAAAASSSSSAAYSSAIYLSGPVVGGEFDDGAGLEVSNELSESGETLAPHEQHPTMGDYFAHLQELDFGQCKLTYIRWTTLEGLNQLKRLLLDGNQLSQLSGKLVAALPVGLHQLSLEENPWKCDCRLFSLKRWLLTTRTPLNLPVRCHSSSTLFQPSMLTSSSSSPSASIQQQRASHHQHNHRNHRRSPTTLGPKKLARLLQRPPMAPGRGIKSQTEAETSSSGETMMASNLNQMDHDQSSSSSDPATAPTKLKPTYLDEMTLDDFVCAPQALEWVSTVDRLATSQQARSKAARVQAAGSKQAANDGDRLAANHQEGRPFQLAASLETVFRYLEPTLIGGPPPGRARAASNGTTWHQYQQQPSAPLDHQHQTTAINPTAAGPGAAANSDHLTHGDKQQQQQHRKLVQAKEGERVTLNCSLLAYTESSLDIIWLVDYNHHSTKANGPQQINPHSSSASTEIQSPSSLLLLEAHGQRIAPGAATTNRLTTTNNVGRLPAEERFIVLYDSKLHRSNNSTAAINPGLGHLSTMTSSSGHEEELSSLSSSSSTSQEFVWNEGSFYGSRILIKETRPNRVNSNVEFIFKESQIIIQSVQVDDSARYKCIAMNRAGNTSFEYLLHVGHQSQQTNSLRDDPPLGLTISPLYQHSPAGTRDQRAHSANNGAYGLGGGGTSFREAAMEAANKARILAAQSSQVTGISAGGGGGGGIPTTLNPSGTWLKSSRAFQITIVVVSVLMAAVIFAFLLFCIIIYQIKPTSGIIGRPQAAVPPPPSLTVIARPTEITTTMNGVGGNSILNNIIPMHNFGDFQLKPQLV